MDTCNNGSPTQGGATAAIGNSAVEFGDWRNQLQRQRSVHKIMDTLKMHLPFSRNERLQELMKIAERVEEEVYTAAIGQSEYTRKICFMMLSIETRLQNRMSDPIRFDGSWQEEVYQEIKAMKDLYLLELLELAAQSSNQSVEDWQEEVHQKIKAMKDLYLLDLNNMYQKVLSKLQQHDSLPQQPRNEQLEKLKVFKNMLERYMQFLQIPKHGILASYKDKLGTYVKQIIYVINSNRRKPTAPQQQAQALPPQHMQSLQQSQQTHSQLTQVHSHDQMNLQGSMAAMQPNNMGNLQQNAVSLSGGSNAQQNMMSSIQPGSNLDQGQNSSMNSLQQVSGGSLQQNTVNGPQQVNINPLSVQGNPNMLQHQHIKQQEQLLQSQQLKQFQQRQLQQQYLHKQQLMQQQQQQFHQQTKQQLPGTQLSQLPQISDSGDIKLRQQMGVKPGGFQQHHAAAAAAQRSAYHQQLKTGAPFSPQLLSAASPQLSQHASPQIDQSNMFKSANSPFTVPSPSTSSASPLPQHMQSLQQSQQTHSQLTQVQSHDQMNLQGSMAAMQPNNMGNLQQNCVSLSGGSNAQQNMMSSVQPGSNLDQTGNPNGRDWQEEVYQKIKAMKDLYLLDLNDMHQKTMSKLQQHYSLPQQPRNEQLEKLKVFKNMLERFMQFLQLPKHGILANYKDKLGTYEEQIINVINSNRRSLQSLQQSNQTHSQLTQVQSHDQMNLQGSMEAMQPNNMGNLQQNAVSLSGGSNAQHNVMNSIQPKYSLDPGSE